MDRRFTIELAHPEDLVMKDEYIMDEIKKPKPFKITLKSRKLWVIKGYTATEGYAEEAFGEVLNGQLYTSEILAKHAAEKLAAMYNQKIYANGEQPTEDELQEQHQWLSVESYLINTDGL